MIALLVAAWVSATPAEPRAPAWYRADATSITSPARRIVSFAPVVTETLFRLGAGDRVVGVTRFCDRPAEAQRLPKIGGYVDISLERVLALKPDLVVAMPTLGQRDILDLLRERGIPVRIVFADTLDETRALLRDLGVLVNQAPTAAALERELDLAMMRLRKLRLPPQRAAVVVGIDPIVVAGPRTFAMEALALAGLTAPFPADAPLWPVWSLESLAASRTQILIAAEGQKSRARLALLVEGALSAERRPRVFAAARPILMRPGPSLAEDLDELARLLEAQHP